MAKEEDGTSVLRTSLARVARSSLALGICDVRMFLSGVDRNQRQAATKECRAKPGADGSGAPSETEIKSAEQGKERSRHQWKSRCQTRPWPTRARVSGCIRIQLL